MKHSKMEMEWDWMIIRVIAWLKEMDIPLEPSPNNSELSAKTKRNLLNRKD
ncbi:MAG: hypothetical protein Q4D38_07365 [Planctomycetia bacterium]|nr:hypothetical protein [Planctomycetia bacterium]